MTARPGKSRWTKKLNNAPKMCRRARAAFLYSYPLSYIMSRQRRALASLSCHREPVNVLRSGRWFVHGHHPLVADRCFFCQFDCPCWKARICGFRETGGRVGGRVGRERARAEEKGEADMPARAWAKPQAWVSSACRHGAHSVVSGLCAPKRALAVASRALAPPACPPAALGCPLLPSAGLRRGRCRAIQ